MKQIKKYWVLCEGKDDQAIIENLCSHASLNEKITCESYDGTSQLEEHLKTFCSRPVFTSHKIKRILITRDNDNEPSASWNKLVQTVQTVFGIQITQENVWTKSTKHPHVEIAICMIPAKDQNGMIETIFLNAVREKTPEFFQCLDSFTACLSEQKKQALHPKVLFGYWVLAQKNSRRTIPLNKFLAEQSAFINWSHPTFSNLMNALSNICK